jgi:hypothetical protein
MAGRVRLFLIALGVMALLPALFDTAWAAAGKPTALDPSPCEAACEVGRFIDLNLGLTQRPLTLGDLQHFAKLQSDTPKPAEGGGTLHELVYPGLRLRVYAPTSGAVLVEQIAVDGSAYKLPFGLKLGAGPADLESLLGPATEMKPTPPEQMRWVYRNSEGTAWVAFDIEKDTAITSVEWHFGGD